MEVIEKVVRFLEHKNLQVVVAESCTAGLVTSLLADISGCGSIFEFGYVVYSEKAKHICLGVDLKTIDLFGLTSEEVAREMAVGALERSNANIAIAVTGTAESDDVLSGVVCFAFAISITGTHKLSSETVRFRGSRNEVRKAAAEHAILRIPHYVDSVLFNT